MDLHTGDVAELSLFLDTSLTYSRAWTVRVTQLECDSNMAGCFQYWTGNSGIITSTTGVANGGSGGNVEVFVGTGDSGDGGDVILVAGETTADSTTGGMVMITGGHGSSTKGEGGNGGTVYLYGGEASGSSEYLDLGGNIEM